MSRHTIEGDYDQTRLYNLIWKRTLASQMSDAQLERTNVKIAIACISSSKRAVYRKRRDDQV